MKNKFFDLFGGIWAWICNAWNFSAMHFKDQKDIKDGKSRALKVIYILGIAGAVISAATSLNYTIPAISEVVYSWFSKENESYAFALTIVIVVSITYAIEGGMTVTVPFAFSLVAAVIAEQVNFIKSWTNTPAAGASWYAKKGVGFFQNLLGFGGFLLAIIRLKANAIASVAVLALGLSAALGSMYMTYNGNDWQANERADNLRPTSTVAEVLVETDSLRRKSKDGIKKDFDKEVSAVKATAKKDLANAIVDARAAAAEARKATLSKYGKDYAAGNVWAANQISAAFSQIKNDSLETIKVASVERKIAALKLKRDNELSNDSLHFATLSVAKVDDVKSGGDRFAKKRDGIAVIWQFAGMLATPFFLLCCLISTIIKVVDFQALTNAVGAAVGAAATAKSAVVATTVATANTGGGNYNTIPTAIVNTNTNTKPRDSKGRTLGEVGSDIADSLARLNGAVKQGNAKSAKTNATNLAQGLADYLAHPEHYGDAQAMAALDAKLDAMEATAKKNGWTVYKERDITDIANS